MNKTQMKKYLLGLYKKDTGLYWDATDHDKITYEARLRLLENIMIEMFHFRVVRVKDTTTIYSNFQKRKNSTPGRDYGR